MRSKHQWPNVVVILSAGAVIALAATPLLAVDPPSADTTLRYEIATLGDLGDDSTATAINERGQVAGLYYVGLINQDVFPYAWEARRGMIALPDLGQPPAIATDINNVGSGVGFAALPNGTHHGVIWHGLEVTDVGTIQGWSDSEMFAINDDGVAVGRATGLASGDRAIIFDERSGLRLLSKTGSSASDITNSGLVVGGGGYLQPAIWWHEKQSLHPVLPGFEFGHMSNVSELADQHRHFAVVGTSFNDNHPSVNRATLWTVEVLQSGEVLSDVFDLGNYPGDYGSFAYAVNSSGQVVGAGESEVVLFRPLLWRDGAIYSLNDLKPPDAMWNIIRSYDINDAGQIVGEGYHLGQIRSFIMTPVGFTLDQVDPGRAGAVNTVRVRDLPPGVEVQLYLGEEEGYSYLASCGGMGLSILDARFAGSAMTGADGTAVFSGFIPRGFAGRTLRFEAATPGSCQVSNVVRVTLQ